MFKHAAAFYQDITGWSNASLTTPPSMFTDAGAWLNRLERDGTTSTAARSNVWVHKPCLVNERVQSGWCVPCGGMFSNAAGDDPAAGVDTACDGDSQGLKDAVNACLSAVPSGEACCSTDTNCADPSSARCGSAGCVDMPEWDVSLVTDMSELFKDKADFNVDISAWDTSQVTDMGTMFWRLRVQPRHRIVEYLAGHEHVGHVPMRRRVQSRSDRDTAGQNMNAISWRRRSTTDRLAWNTSQVQKLTAHMPEPPVQRKPSATWNTSQVTDMADMFHHAAIVQPRYQHLEYLQGDGDDIPCSKEPPPSTRISPAGAPPR